MNRTAHPILSPMGCLGGSVLILGILIAVWLSGGAIFSPGELSVYAEGHPLKGFATHAEFENDCTQCHAPGAGITAERCEACHTGVAVERRTATGLHGKLESAQSGRCAACHPDHRGRDFNANAHAIRSFDHSVLGFSLARHALGYDNAPLGCENCHTAITFAFEPATCVQCHGDHDEAFMSDHVKAFGPTCADCHDGVDKTSEFDHAATDFPLEAKHARTDCAGCHSPQIAPAEAKTECAACHAEPAGHKDAFAETDCATCHTPDGWKPARLGDRPAFNHTDTAFQLVHHVTDYAGAPITCKGCHLGATDGDFTLTAETCVLCHAVNDQAFMGEHVAKYGPNCVSCHDGAGNMEGFDHARVFVLEGVHAATACADCHEGQVFKGTPSACADCHGEPAIHAGVFGLKCDSCHTASAWVPAQLIRHTFPLDHGGEGEIACETCHLQSYTQNACAGCHEPVEMETKHAELKLAAEELVQCASCHPLGLTEGDETP
ncbi:MAG: hypothetical protein JNL73_02025 [Anaerolineales bacterium]|nr:hypothetical protein [Anaerolineales bacterium]